MLNTSIVGTSVIRYRPSRQLTKERGVTGIIADNQKRLIYNSKNQLIEVIF